MALPKTQDDWERRVSTFLKAKIRDSDLTYVELAKRLKRYGFTETEASVTNKLKRGTFAATFMLACLATLDLDKIEVREIAG